MRAALLTAPGALHLSRMPRPACPPGGALLRVEACGLCASDLKMWRQGHKELELPRVLGHEVSGVVEESQAEGLTPGDAVQVAPGMPCGECPACGQGAHNRCHQVEVLGFSRDGGLAQYLAVPAKGVRAGAVIPLPDGVDFSTASLAEPLACALNAWQQAGLCAGEKVAVLGAGPVGRLAAWSAQALGAERVAVLEVEPRRLRGLGDMGVDASTRDPLQRARRALAGQADVVLPACPAPEALVWGLELLRPGGRLVLFSGLKRAASQDLNRAHYRELSMIGAYGCTAQQNRRALEFFAKGTFPVQEIISHRLPLSQVETGLELMESRAALKVIIHPQEE